MSYESSHGYDRPTGRLYRNRDLGMLMGVCAGLASFLDVQAGMVRVIVIIAALLFFWPTVLTYFALGFLLKDEPLSYRGRGSERRFWRGSSHCDREYR